MNQNWPTKDKDMLIAEQVIEEYATQVDSDTLGLFEVVHNHQERHMGFRLANWVTTLARHFVSAYGPEQGDYVTRKVVTRCLINGQTLH
ncbi:hypothetical protein [Legionella sp. CNM-4043-24]|uniref:hypothetical protein n=1 Tax=Legionella sp. CNM-4043-24 TaxID=3421646 RepID=UPI00403AAA9D